MRTTQLTALLAALFSATALLGCGGGGGDGESDFSGASTTSLNLTPSEIDSGDRALIEMSVGDVHENGIALKLRYPEGLVYVPSSAKIIVDDKETALTPLINQVTPDKESVYLVFYLRQKSFKRPGEDYNGEPATIQLQLAGKSAVRDGLVEVDTDVDDPAIVDAQEFNIASPEFLADDQASISVQVAD